MITKLFNICLLAQFFEEVKLIWRKRDEEMEKLYRRAGHFVQILKNFMLLTFKDDNTTNSF